MKTLYFEKKFGVNIDDFHATTEIDEFIESRIGKKLKGEEYEN
jgi:hypothetical protein